MSDTNREDPEAPGEADAAGSDSAASDAGAEDRHLVGAAQVGDLPAPAGELALEDDVSEDDVSENGASEDGAEEQVGGEMSLQQAAAQLGVMRYVHAAFLAAAVLASYLLGHVALAVWNLLADTPDVARQLPVLLEYSEEQRASATLIIGAVVGVLLVLSYYRRPSVKNWATEVAGELARVTWPDRETVTNGTIIVLVAGAVAAVYVTVLDRLWGYLTNLVYGA